MSSLCHAFREGQNIWATACGMLPVENDDLLAAGLRRNPKQGFRRDLRYRILGDFMEMLALDEWIEVGQ